MDCNIYGHDQFVGVGMAYNESFAAFHWCAGCLHTQPSKKYTLLPSKELDKIVAVVFLAYTILIQQRSNFYRAVIILDYMYNYAGFEKICALARTGKTRSDGIVCAEQ